MLSKTEFAVLSCLEKNTQKLTQRQIKELCGFSLGTSNKVYNELTKSGFIADSMITEAGLAALEPYRVKRAIFLSAGFGSRLIPITLNTPKPLVRVHGVRMIDTLLDAVVRANIPEIYIVRGYLSEQFDILLKKYPKIKFIENNMFNETNNISSAYLVRNLISGSYVMEADLVLSNPDLITKYQYKSNYLGVPTKVTDDWCFQTHGTRITQLSVGGVNCYHMFGISYWTVPDGEKLASHLEMVFHSPGGKERYWDQVPLEYFIKDYNIDVRICSFEDIVEIDTFSDLKIIDKTYEISKC